MRRDFPLPDGRNNDMTEFSHYSVMLHECIDGLQIKPDGLYVDCTAGGGGHSKAIAQRLSPEQGGRLLAIDQDSDAILAAGRRLEPYADRVTLIHSNFSKIASILDGRQPDGVLIDLGISSYQIDNPERGFSYMQDAPLDMRMNPSDPISAYDIVNHASESELSDILFKWGEERFAKRIAARIAASRKVRPISSTLELSDIVRASIPAKSVEKGSHPAKRTFQAIRIAVNHEIDIIPPTVSTLIDALAPNGRLVILTFHSLEDRAVKQAMKQAEKGCTCPPELPVCVCGKKPLIEIITKKPLLPSPEELAENPRSHSAKLRIARKLTPSEQK